MQGKANRKLASLLTLLLLISATLPVVAVFGVSDFQPFGWDGRSGLATIVAADLGASGAGLSELQRLAGTTLVFRFDYRHFVNVTKPDGGLETEFREARIDMGMTVRSVSNGIMEIEYEVYSSNVNVSRDEISGIVKLLLGMDGYKEELPLTHFGAGLRLIQLGVLSLYRELGAVGQPSYRIEYTEYNDVQAVYFTLNASGDLQGLQGTFEMFVDAYYDQLLGVPLNAYVAAWMYFNDPEYAIGVMSTEFRIELLDGYDVLKGFGLCDRTSVKFIDDTVGEVAFISRDGRIEDIGFDRHKLHIVVSGEGAGTLLLSTPPEKFIGYMKVDGVYVEPTPFVEPGDGSMYIIVTFPMSTHTITVVYSEKIAAVGEAMQTEQLTTSSTSAAPSPSATGVPESTTITTSTTVSTEKETTTTLTTTLTTTTGAGIQTEQGGLSEGVGEGAGEAEEEVGAGLGISGPAAVLVVVVLVLILLVRRRG